MSGARYVGKRQPGRGAVVYVSRPGEPATLLDPRRDILDHSPDGFEWGYQGSGPAQLALAILADHFDDERRALLYHQPFKRLVIAALPGPGSAEAHATWAITAAEVDAALAHIENLKATG